tara:strand:- start:4343 stop:4819 length:477 start_codon:yes stop_codon:yes gene_type:complete
MGGNNLTRLAVLVGVFGLMGFCAACAVAGADGAGGVVSSLALAGVLATPVSMSARVLELVKGVQRAADEAHVESSEIALAFGPVCLAIGNGDPELLANLKEQAAGRVAPPGKDITVNVNLDRLAAVLKKDSGGGGSNLKVGSGGGGEGSGGGGSGVKK